MFPKFCLDGQTLAKYALRGNKYKVLSMLRFKKPMAQVKDSREMTQQGCQTVKKCLRYFSYYY